MKQVRLALIGCCLLIGCATELQAQQLPPAKVDFDAYEQLVATVKKHRSGRLVSLNRFLEMSQEKGVVILDTRSDEMYRRKHIKGAIHLNFSDFTQESLARLIPDPNTRILIYCNNNIDGDPFVFATKAAKPKLTKAPVPPITLALNIPTYINLYGYGCRNVYELSDLVSILDNRIVFEGLNVRHSEPIRHTQKTK